jgi:hypothetical protein
MEGRDHGDLLAHSGATEEPRPRLLYEDHSLARGQHKTHRRLSIHAIRLPGRELVEVFLEVLGQDAVVDAVKPTLQEAPSVLDAVDMYSILRVTHPGG